MKLKQKILTAGALVLLAAAPTTQAALYSQIFNTGLANGGSIPDATTRGPSAWSDMRSISGQEGLLSYVAVTLNISGGYNGDLYAYLAHNNQTLVLLNRVGTGVEGQSIYGFSTSGLSNVRLDDRGADSIHTIQNPQSFVGPNGVTYTPDSGLATFASAFNGLPANGTWTLFFADMSSGGVSKVDSWELSFDLAAVPEPVNVALASFGTVAAGFLAWRKCKTSKRRLEHVPH